MSRSPLASAAAALNDALRLVQGRYVLIGGLAVVLRGFPRHTDDIDVMVLGAAASASQLMDALASSGFVPRVENALEFAARSQVLLMVHADSGIELDLSLGWLPFEREAVEAAELIDIEDVPFPVARAEDLLIYKAVAWRDRDQRDIKELVRLHRDELDLERVQRTVEQFAEAIDEPERGPEFARLVASVLRAKR
ncbi:MAG: nucleotidyl transferase AbiEii/AbiGii toxin family protein [Polyangiales bacterium]|nr:nucleotidyltransferase [Myxococcales bacterium]MCB9656768.1 nucleotidyltransferase [Sandaracinaceae bacterium]